MSRRPAYPSAEPANAGVPDIERHISLVKKIAYLLMSRLPASVELDDLVQVGLIGLIEASRQFDASQGVLFETFASQRVRGAMLDELRRADWLPRQARKQAKQIEEAISRLEQNLARPPREPEIAEALGLSLDDYQDALFDCKGHQLVYYEDFAVDEDQGDGSVVESIADVRQVDPIDILNDSGFRHGLVEAIKTLPERDQLVMSLYYEQELNLKEIGEVLGVTESRVCQLHSQAVARLRTKLRDWF